MKWLNPATEPETSHSTTSSERCGRLGRWTVVSGTPPVDIDLPVNVRARDAPVQLHALETYDQLKDVVDE